MTLLVGQASGYEATILIGMQGVRHSYREQVKENSRRFRKKHPMLLKIGFRLLWVPFELGVHADNIRNLRGEEKMVADSKTRSRRRR